MPMDRSKYPTNWKEISDGARARAGERCEACGLPNGAIITRSDIDPAYYLMWDMSINRWRYMDGSIAEEHSAPVEYFTHRPIKVVLTVHHAGVQRADGTPGDPNDKMDNRPENLQALCQRCHLLADQATHIDNRKKNSQQRKLDQLIASGQIMLFKLD